MPQEVKFQLKSVPFTSVDIDDKFWAPRLEVNRTVTIPYDFKKCEETGRIDNFAKAGGLMEGDHEGIYYNDSDVFKVIEGASYSLSIHPELELESYLDDLIAKIAASQEEDGYLYTARTIAEKAGKLERLKEDREGRSRWSNLPVNHELYNVGHMYEAAVAHYSATGKREFLDVAIKNAHLIDQVFGSDKKRDVPGHEEIEIGLVKLYQVTGEERYLRLAQFFVDERGRHDGRPTHKKPEYIQDHKPVLQQSEAVGHAVRAGYLYSGVTDVAAHTGERAYINAIDRIWEDVVSRKLYITGGIGALHQGEAFGAPYQLPNESAYAETCAAIANALWNHRMFLLHGDGKYIDVLERVIYNGFLSGVSFSGDLFFYVNPLAYDGESNFNRDTSRRQPWYTTSCCPTNVVRFLPSLPGYVYAQGENSIYINTFIEGKADLTLEGESIEITQKTDYPWDAQIKIEVNPGSPAEFTLCVRVPGWAQDKPVPSDLYKYIGVQSEGVSLKVNGEEHPLNLDKGFARIGRRWQKGDRVELNLAMEVRRVIGHELVEDDAGRVALERGPLVYCTEGIDNDGSVADLVLPDDVPLKTEHRRDLLNGVTVINGQLPDAGNRELTAIPYYSWAHRGLGDMTVWLRRS